MEKIKKYLVGIDLSTTGACAITDGERIIDVLKYPKDEYDVKKYNELSKQIIELKDEPRSKTKIKQLKAEKKAIKRRAIRDYNKIYQFLYPYKDNIKSVVIEEPLRQMAFGSTSSDTLCSNHITFGVYLSILSILGLEYKLFLPQEWHKEFPFKFEGKLSQKERREKIKEQSIQFAKNKFSNIGDYLFVGKSKKEDDNICESAILSLLGDSYGS